MNDDSRTTVHGDLEAAFVATNHALLLAVGDSGGGYPTWCRQVAAGHRAMAEIYATAADGLPTHGVLWHALQEAINARRDRAKDLETRATRLEQEGQ
jgi:hypothetical protein